jgi:hypothetical protein
MDTTERESTERAARKAARELCASSMAWGKTFGACIARHERTLEERWFREILAYGLYLLESRVAGHDPAVMASLKRAIKTECADFIARGKINHPRGDKQLGSPQDSRPSSRIVAESTASDYANAPISPAGFEKFCRATGLSSQILVGDGNNLAAILFYMVVHEVASTEKPLERKDAKLLLEAAQKCRIQLQECVSKALKADRRKQLHNPSAAA